jgi:hypothetical protein
VPDDVNGSEDESPSFRPMAWAHVINSSLGCSSSLGFLELPIRLSTLSHFRVGAAHQYTLPISQDLDRDHFGILEGDDRLLCFGHLG